MDTRLRIIARIQSAFPTKFGVPRQSGLAPLLRAKVVFEPAFRQAEALRGLESFSHLWLLWGFSEAVRRGGAGNEGKPDKGLDWSPTVRPPRLGGNVRMGVFATRSPFRPNPLGLSAVKLEGIQEDPVQGPVLLISGADLMDGTPIFDIKPYLPSADCIPDALGGFTDAVPKPVLHVVVPDEVAQRLPSDTLAALRQVLALDPRPAYQHSPEKVYGFPFDGFEVQFTVLDGVLTVIGLAREGHPAPFSLD